MSQEFSVRIQAETANAILIHDFASESDVWIPLSQVDEIHRQKDGTATIVITDWIARVKGLI